MTDDKNIFQSISDYREEYQALLSKAICEGLREVDLAKKSGAYIGSYYDWPRLSVEKNGLPSLHFSNFDSPIDYTKCFGSLGSKPIIDENNISSFSDLVEFVKARPMLYKRFVLDTWETNNELNIDFCAALIISKIKNAIDRYIHLFNSFEYDEKLSKIVEDPIVSFIFDPSLNIDIIIPILFLDFETDSHLISDRVELVKLTDKQHLARTSVKLYNVSVHDKVVSSATHALFLRGWNVKNSENSMGFNILSNPRAYPIEIIDKFFGAIRVVSGQETGYAQVMAHALGWARYTRGDLPYMEGATYRSYPSKFEDYYWNIDHVPTISNSQLSEIGEVFASLLDAKENSLDLALKRLNRCLVRDNEEDSVLDATIALEALLSDDGNQEMTHKLAMRVGALSMLSEDFDESPQEIFSGVKKIYAYRSAIVHGSKSVDKKRVIKVSSESETTAHSLVVSYLRNLLKILINHPKYRDPKVIDDELLLGKKTLV